MGIKLYGLMASTAVTTVVMTLMEKGVTDFELVDVDMPNGAHKQPEYLALQPFGRIPAMVDGSLTLFESRAIARYLARKYEGQGTPLYGFTEEDTAVVEQWMEVESQNFNTAFVGISNERLRKVYIMGMPPDESVVATHVQNLSKILDIYETHLAKNKYLAGDFFSLADLFHLPGLRTLCGESLKLGDLVNARPHVKAWFEDIRSRPSWERISEEVTESMTKVVAARKEHLAKTY